MSPATLKICAVTMLRDDDFFLKRWIDYYGACLGRENLYILFDGQDQVVPDFCNGLNIKKFPHRSLSVHEGDRYRIGIVNSEAERLFERYDAVIGGDVDEFLVPDPLSGESLPQMISRIAASCPRWHSISALGVDVGQNLECEKDIIDGKPFLSQRGRSKLSTRYSKASVLLRRSKWGSGFHRVKGHNFHIVKDLYLFHFGCVSMSRIKAKMGDEALAADGWGHHLKKRAKTIYLCSTMRPVNWTVAVPVARALQNIFRPPYAWNKPSMFEARVVVEIPERFKDIV